MTTKTVHLHKNKLDRDHNILYLLIPAIVFAILLTLLFSRKSVQTTATVAKPDILGERESLD